MKTLKAGFTLIEMLVVISIIVVLMTLLGGGLMRYYRRAEGIANVQFLQTVENLVGNFQGDFGHYPYYAESGWANGHRGTVEEVNRSLYNDLAGTSSVNRDANYFDGVLSAQSPHLRVTTEQVGGGRGRGRGSTLTRGMILDAYGNPLIYLYDTKEGERPGGAPGFIGGMRSYFELWSMGPSGAFYNLTHSSVDKEAPNRTEDDDNEIATNIGSGERFSE